MEEQPAVRPLTAPRPAPEGSVPVGGVETLDDREDAQDLQNPYAADPGAAATGERLFNTHCAICHGAKGHGDGKVSAKFPQRRTCATSRSAAAATASSTGR